MYKVKYNTDDWINRYTTRLVAKGNEQQHDIDYDEAFASVVKDNDRPSFAAGFRGKGVALTWYKLLDFVLE